MRVLSPRILPPPSVEEGSIAKTASLWPFFSTILPNSSINVLFPTPGTPVIPIRHAPPVRGKIAEIKFLASLRNSGESLSISVIAEAKPARSFANNNGNNLAHVKLSNLSFLLLRQSSEKLWSVIK